MPIICSEPLSWVYDTKKINLHNKDCITPDVQGKHDKCNEESRCKSDGYVMSKKMLTDVRAIAAYKKAISGTTIYRHAADYMRVTISCSQTFWKSLEFVFTTEWLSLSVHNVYLWATYDMVTYTRSFIFLLVPGNILD